MARPSVACRKMLLTVAATFAIASANAASAQSETGQAADKPLQSLSETQAQTHGPLSQRVLDFLEIMDEVVNRDKQPAITAADWAPLGDLVDREKFVRVGNFGEVVNWDQYADLLTMWANTSWWKGYIWRIREIPASDGQPGLVYLESEERSNQTHPVLDDGDYSTLASIAVYQFDEEGKITALHVYDQRPLQDAP